MPSARLESHTRGRTLIFSQDTGVVDSGNEARVGCHSPWCFITHLRMTASKSVMVIHERCEGRKGNVTTVADKGSRLLKWRWERWKSKHSLALDMKPFTDYLKPELTSKTLATWGSRLVASWWVTGIETVKRGWGVTSCIANCLILKWSLGLHIHRLPFDFAQMGANDFCWQLRWITQITSPHICQWF